MLYNEREKMACSNQTEADSFSFATLTRARAAQLHSRGTLTKKIKYESFNK